MRWQIEQQDKFKLVSDDDIGRSQPKKLPFFWANRKAFARRNV